MKKVLAWAVALALVLSSFTMAFAADAPNSSQFKDADQINYTEAVDVMVATGIINGFPDGTFGPQKTVQRDQMAKMIACIMNGGEDVGDQYKSACPFADSQSSWAAGYIAYCASEHIIDGRSADVFDPTATVTGTEVAKMALTSLGYDSKIQGYTGENWAANVLKDAKKAKLFAGLDKSFVAGDPCDRESAAQILFNMLKAPMVEYDTNINMTTADGTSVSVASKVQPVKAEDEWASETETNPGETGYVELYEEVFGEDSDATLEQIATAEDEFGRPGHAWKVEGDDVGTYTNSVSYEFTVEDSDDLEAAITAYNEDVAKELCAVEEGQDGQETPAYNFSYMLNGKESTSGEPEIYLGDKIELYVDGTSVQAVIIQYKPYLITKVNTNVSKADAKKDVTAYVYLTQNGGNGQKINDTELTGYNDTYVEGAVIAVAANSDGVVDSYVLEEVAIGAVEKVVYMPAYAFTVDGTKYEVTDAYKGVDGNTIESASKDAEYTLYDYNGYVIASVQGKAAPEVYSYGVLIAKGVEEGTTDKYGNTSADRYYVQIVTAEKAEVEEFIVSDDYVNAETNAYPYKEDEAGSLTTPLLVAYTLENDEITLIKEGTETPEALQEGTTVGNEDTLAGLFVSEDVVAFANAKAPTDTEDKWVVYGIDDLRTVENDGIKADTCFKDNNNEGENFVALLLTEDLEEAPAADVVLGFISNVTEIGELSDGTFVANISAFLNGEDEVTTFENVPLENVEGISPFVLYTFTEDSDGVVTIAAVEPQDATETGLVKEFETGKIAAAILEADVTAKKGTSVDIGHNDLQNVGNAVIYYLNDEGQLEVSSYDNISDVADDEPVVYLYQTEAGSKSWNYVIYEDTNSSYRGF